VLRSTPYLVAISSCRLSGFLRANSQISFLSLLINRFFGFDGVDEKDATLVADDSGGRRVELEDDSDVAADMTLIAGELERGWVELEVERE